MRTLLLLILCLLSFFPGYSQEQEVMDITICWDVSTSMEARNYEKEKEFLDQYFSTHPDATVNLLRFSNTIWGREQVEINSGNWSELEKRLRNVAYDGATSYRELPLYTGGQEILLFTDGRRNMDDATPVFNGKLYIINSVGSYDAANLNLLSIMNDGEVVNLAAKDANIPVNGRTTYYGTIYGYRADASSLRLNIKGRESEVVRPDADGRYAINAKPGEVLEFSVDERKAAERLLGRHENINIWLEDSGEIRLDEVVLTTTRAVPGTEMVETAVGPKNKDAVGYAVQSITDEQISEASTNVSSAVQGKFSGVTLGQNDDLSQFKSRSSWSILSNNYGLIVIDGVPIGKSNSSTFASATSNQNTGFIDPRNIANITVLKGLVATNRFGSAGANGVLLITTKTASIAKVDQKKDLALLTDNIYDGRIRANDKNLITGYLKALQKGRNVGEAYEVYLKQRPAYLNNYTFFIDVFDYFRKAGPELALRIFTNILEMEDPGRPGLKALLFKAREIKDADLELQTARKIQERFPGRIDTYLDLALANRSAGNYQETLDILLGMNTGSLNTELDFTPLKKSVEREIRDLVFGYQSKLDLAKLPQQYRNNLRYNARIIFSWNQPEAEFGLQFVNPQKRFFTWEHSRAENSRRLRQEIEEGFSSEEFEIFGEGVAGDWILNVNYLGSGRADNTDPVFLNCRIEFNFGKPGRRTEEYVVRLHEPGSELQLAKIKLE